MRPVFLLSPFILSLSAFASHAAEEAKPINRASLLGVDANNDGIRDDIQALVAKSEEGKAVAAKQSAFEKPRLPTIEPKAAPKALQPRSSCLDYMVSSPQAQQRAQRLTSGVPGTHPCDPVVSPLIDRPYDREFVQIGPVTIRR